MPTIEFLERFAEGWNRHDLDGLMTFMTDDCVFETTADPEVCGKHYAGREQVREAFARVFKMFPRVRSKVHWFNRAGFFFLIRGKGQAILLSIGQNSYSV